MVRAARRTWHRRACALVGAAALAAGGIAPRASAEDKPVEAGTVSIASLDKLADSAKRLGVDLPGFLTAPGLEQMFAFVGKNGLKTTAPLGLVYYSEKGWNMQAGQGVVFVLPVNAGAAPLATFTNLGGKPVDGQADCVLLNNVIFRRTDSDLMWGVQPGGSVVEQTNPADLAKPYQAQQAEAGEDLIAYTTIDIKNLRDADPKAFEQFITTAAQNGASPAAGAYERAGQQFGQQLVVQWCKQLDTLDLSLLQADKGLVVRMGVSPAHLPEAGNFHMAGLPGDVAISVHLAAQLDTIYPGAQDFLSKFGDVIRNVQDTANSPDDQSAIDDIVKSSDALVFGGKAESIGVVPDGQHHGMVYIVEQGAAPLEGRMTDWADKFNAGLKKLDAADTTVPKATVEHLTTSGGLRETRVTLREGHATDFLIDGVEKDGKVYLTLADRPGDYLDKLANLPEGGPMPALISGMIKLDQMHISTNSSPSIPWPAAMAGQEITFSVNGRKDGAECEVQLPQDLLKQVIGMFTSHEQSPSDTGPHSNQPPKDGGL